VTFCPVTFGPWLFVWLFVLWLSVLHSVPMDVYVCQQYFTYRYMCFLGFIRYNKTFIECGYRKYENFVLARVCRPVPLMFFMNEMSILYIYCMLVREIWKFIHPICHIPIFFLIFIPLVWLNYFKFLRKC
jgi:hypothetical protein